MNPETTRIRDQYLRAAAGDCWPADNLDQVLDGISADLASRRVLPHAKTIHELVQHLVYTESIVTARLRGQQAPWDEKAAWLDPVAQGLSWPDSLAALRASRTVFLTEFDQIGDADLDRPVSTGASSVYVTLHGHIQHTLYHLGQITLLRGLLKRQ